MFGTTLLQHRFEKYRYDAVTPGTVFVMYLQSHKVLMSNSEGILSYSGLKKVLFHMTKTCYYLENVFNS